MRQPHPFHTQHISFLTTDKLQLPGLLYLPTTPTSKVAVWLHGMGDNGVFYKTALMHELALALTTNGIALLAFNNRGAHNRKSLVIVDDTLPEEERRYPGGTHNELISDCLHDISGAVDFLKSENFKTLFLVGHSTGANKICAYDHQIKESPFSKYVLSGPGDDSGMWRTALGANKFDKALKLSQELMSAGKPLALMPKYSGLNPFSAQSAFDILDPNGPYNTFPYYEATTQRLGTKPLFNELRTIKAPVMAICGSEDSSLATAGGVQQGLNLLQEHTAESVRTKSKYVQIPSAEHNYTGYEQLFAEQVAGWLSA